MVPDFLDSDLPIERQGDKLPHWQQDEVMQFVTFRLGDALPKAKSSIGSGNVKPGYRSIRSRGVRKRSVNSIGVLQAISKLCSTAGPAAVCSGKRSCVAVWLKS